MKIHLETGAGMHIIRNYGPGHVTIDDTAYHASLILSPEAMIPDWAPQTLAELRAENLLEALTLEPEVVLLGTGQRLSFPPAEVRAALAGTGVGLEVMDTAAACRTYNILMGEGRRVAAALLMIEAG